MYHDFFTVHHHYIASVLLLQLLNSLSSELDVMLSELCSGSPNSLISGELDDECFSEDYRYCQLILFQLIVCNLIQREFWNITQYSTLTWIVIGNEKRDAAITMYYNFYIHVERKRDNFINQSFKKIRTPDIKYKFAHPSRPIRFQFLASPIIFKWLVGPSNSDSQPF